MPAFYTRNEKREIENTESLRKHRIAGYPGITQQRD